MADQSKSVDLIVRLRAAARDVADHVDALAASRELRDRLVVEAADAGCSNRQIGAAAGITHPRVIGILANSQPVDERPEVVPAAGAAA
jgi:hypothetical protein